MTAASRAEWGLEFAAGQFFNADTTPVAAAYKFAVIVDMNNNGFADFEASIGDTFAANSFINGLNDYMTLATGNLSDPESIDAWAAYSDSWAFNNADYGFDGGEEAALIVWDSNSDTLAGGEHYVLVTPSLAGGDLSDGDPWIIPAGDFGQWQWMFLTQSFEGNIADSYGVLANTVGAVPEPSTYAALSGALALVLAVWRRK